jgi:hypothetical protein
MCRWLAVGVLAVFLPLTATGCFGRFQLVRNVYQFNQDVSADKWTQWLVFVVLNFVPVYGFAAWIDAIVVNSIEFWTGENPVKASAAEPRYVHGPDGGVARLALREDRRIDVELTEGNGTVHRFVLAREGPTVTARTLEGTLLAQAGDVDGRPVLLAGAFAPAAP